MKPLLLGWQFWAILAAVFAALTAIFAKVGVEGVGADFATFIRTVVIILALGAILLATGQWQSLGSIDARSYLFLVLSGLATGGSWVCYFRARSSAMRRASRRSTSSASCWSRSSAWSF
jgi:bacterial/archaeal transporter family protein